MLVVDLDELGQLRLLHLDVDERVAVVVEDAEQAVDANVDARRLQQRVVVGIDLDPPSAGSGRSSRRREPRGDSYPALLVRRSRYRGHRGRHTRDPASHRDSRAALPRDRRAKERVVADPLGLYLPVVIAEGRGATVTDVDGNSFVDFTGGVGCLEVGHAHPRVVAAVQEQAARFLHTDFTIVPYEIYVEYAERLTRARAVRRPGEGRVLQRGHRGGRERGQVRARRTRAGRR